MKALHSDIVVVGGGLVGAALSLALIKGGCHVTLLEPHPFAVSSTQDTALDWRVYAISPRNRDHLIQLGVWPDEQAAQAIPRMIVFGDEAGSCFCMDAANADLEALAWIVESKRLCAAIWTQLRASDRVDIITSSPTALAFREEGVSVTLDDRTLFTHLVVGADGARSWVRQAVGIQPSFVSYDQCCVVGNFLAEQPHQGEATQWFRPDGILAFLPLPGNQISLAWSCHPALSNTLLSLSPEELGQWVTIASQAHLGRLKLVSPVQALPLALTELPQTVGKGFALIGDAAHTVHPLAAQGVNLGFGDAWELSRILLSELPARWGDLPILQRYAQARRKRVYPIQKACHTLQVLFARAHPALAFFRNAGLEVANHLPWAKRQLIRYATGST